MNLNKYDSQGFPYTAEEAAERAAAIFMPHYLVKGYTGQEGVIRKVAKPYNAGRNAEKRAAKAARTTLRSKLK